MCGRFTLAAAPAELASAFSGVDFSTVAGGLSPRYNIAPSQPVVAILGAPPRAGFLRWGLVPHWARDPAVGHRMINARAETVAEKPSFREALRKRRCLVPADGFYEWKKERTGKTGTPMRIRLATGAPFAFAGLWESWKPVKGAGREDELFTCALVTTEANALVREIHDRMPVILPARLYAAWLDPAEERPERLLAMLAPYPAGEMTAYPVSPAVNDPRAQGPRLISPAAG
jgi:putative SOS response-associated peptidase YedK